MKGLLGLIAAAIFLLASAKSKQVEEMPIAKPMQATSSHQKESAVKKDGRLIFRLHLPKTVPGNLRIDLENASSYPLGLVQFQFQVLGQGGELQFESIAAKASKSQEVHVDNLLELSLDHVIVIDDKATRRTPEIVVQKVPG